MITIDAVLETYLRSYRGLIETEQLGDSAVLSFPLHLAASHRIEITVTDFGKGKIILSDSARTLGEIQSAGYSLTRRMRERLETIAGAYGMRIVDTHLILETNLLDLGVSIQRFLEMSKTIGDVYLVHKQREQIDDELIAEVKDILQSRGLNYILNEKIQGEIELHPFELVVPSNGKPGLALSVLAGQNTHTISQVWGYKCEDIRRGDWYRTSRGRLALVYDVRHYSWSESSRAILESRADIAVASDSLNQLKDAVVVN
jgi:hypothetical protein